MVKWVVFHPCVEGQGSTPWSGHVKDRKIALAPVASLVSVHHLKPRTELVGPLSV